MAFCVTFGVTVARTGESGGTTMANEKSISDAAAYRSVQPIVHNIGATDLLDALAKGIDDFKAMPTHLVHFCWIYPIVILVGARTYAGYDVLPLAFPLLAGYTLIGPLVATGMYELSRVTLPGGVAVAHQQQYDIMPCECFEKP